MTHDKLIEAGVDALPFVVWRELMMEDVVEYVLDAVEPLIRADERERVSIELERPAAITAHREIRATLRAQVAVLPEGAERRWDGDDGLIWRSDVLDLIGGGSDE